HRELRAVARDGLSEPGSPAGGEEVQQESLRLPAGRYESCRVEELELGWRVTEERACEQVAAREPEHVAVARVAACDPDVRARRQPADQRQPVTRLTPHARPTVRDPRQLADQLDDEFLQLALDQLRRLLDGCGLGGEARIAL